VKGELGELPAHDTGVGVIEVSLFSADPAGGDVKGDVMSGDAEATP